MSQVRRFFALPEERNGDTITVESQYHHMARVLRMRVGDEAIICFNDGMEHLSRVDSIDSKCVKLTILSSKQSDSENSYDTTLYFGVCKGDKNDFVVQKAVELGVNRVVLFDSKYTVGGCDEKKLERLNRIALEASKQCGRAVLVEVYHMTFNEVCRQLSAYDISLMCYEKQQHTTLFDVLPECPQKIAVVIGSEGGFAPEEVELAINSGAVGITLGKRILRAETAPLYVLSLLDGILGRQ